MMMETNLTITPQSQLAEAVFNESGQNVNLCYQCRKCSAGCPISYAMDYKPAQLIHAIRLGMDDLVFKSKTMWLCASCQTCTTRCRRLTAEIQEMLQLANLSSASQQSLPRTKIVSTELLMWCISQVEPVAHERGIVIKTDIRPVALIGTEDHFKMLFVNLLSNAVNYSYRNGQVQICCYRGPNSEPIVTIADKGIGIPANKIHRIFEEHYRTKESVQHNKESSGPGLAIVKHVAELYRIRIRVESRYSTDIPSAMVDKGVGAVL